jgi:hypothetical protein
VACGYPGTWPVTAVRGSTSQDAACPALQRGGPSPGWGRGRSRYSPQRCPPVESRAKKNPAGAGRSCFDSCNSKERTKTTYTHWSERKTKNPAEAGRGLGVGIEAQPGVPQERRLGLALPVAADIAPDCREATKSRPEAALGRSLER